MQLSVYEIITRIDRMRNVMAQIEEGEPIDNYMDFIHDIFDEYLEILQGAKVKIG